MDVTTCISNNDITANNSSELSNATNPNQTGTAHAIQTSGIILNSTSNSAIYAGATFESGTGLPPWFPTPSGSPEPEQITTKAIIYQNAGVIIATEANSGGLKAVTGGRTAGEAIVFQG